ncbi:MAG: type I pullulanase [Oscillospiraceae bacterium]|nr:type I pullulanase [Oscillospiraceae bacterium]
MKKLMSWLLVFAMLLSFVPAGAAAAEGTYFVAGTSSLCGSNWANSDPNNQMTLNADGLYEKTFENVPAGNHAFKVTDGTWDNCWPGSNYEFTTTELQNVTVTFNADTKEINVSLSEPTGGELPEQPPVTEAFYTVAGTAELCGKAWSPDYDANKMTLNTETGLYEKYFVNVPAGEHKFKITDGTWSNCWGNGDDGDGNTVFTTAEAMNILITFNADTKEIGIELIEIAAYYVAGTDGLCGVGWDPGYAANRMYLDTDGLYKKLFKSVPAGTHDYKITDGSWSNNWGAEGVKDGANISFTTDDVYNITITFDPETCLSTQILSEATAPDPVVPVDYPITVKVHYYRPDGNYADWEVHMWNGSGVTTVPSTREFEEENVEFEGTTYERTATYFTNSNETWVGFIVKKPDWTKDPDGDRKIDISDVLSGTVHVYAKSGSALEDFDVVKDDCVKGAKITGAKWDSLTDILTVTTSMAVEGDLMEAFTLFEVVGDEETPIEITSVTKVDGKNDYILGHAEGAIAKDKAYRVYFNGASCDVTIPNTYSTKEFEALYTYTGDDLGATWTAESTTFRVWAPTAAEVYVNLYTAGEGGESLGQVAMTADVNGTWIATVEGDLNGTYYTYSVNVMGNTVEACDPYARTTGVNGNRAMVIDLDSTDPEGWAEDDYVTQDNYTDAVIWELHVRDFSIDESSGVSEANRGKFLAFTEKGTTVNGDGEISTGIDYMVDLGINYVHLLPVYDINSVDETTGGYNWGYDPKNYNVPEGSYSTDPYNGAVRVNEFKQMVQSLHDNGIGVIMDVVYNHVADAGEFCFNKIVPGYFSRIHDDGSYQSNSGCGNDTATERAMVSKYIVDSVLYWNTEYHIDGFRWDLVGLIDYETINAVMEEVHAVNPDIIFYGEGWEMCSWTTKDEGEWADDPYSKKMTIQPNDKLVNTDAGTFAFFNDTIRNVIHGGVFTATDKGFVTGFHDGNRQTVIDGYMAYSKWGSNSERVDTPLQTVNYASCHDNYTLFDNFTVDVVDMNGQALSYETAEAAAVQAYKYNKMAAAYYITAQGVPFIHAGEEMLRSKPTEDAEGNFVFDHNSYSSGDGVNSFKWAMLQDDMVAASYDYYKGLIAFRKAHPALRMTEQSEILAAMESLNTGSDQVVAILNKGGNGENAQILTIINAGTDSYTMNLPEGKWDMYVDFAVAGTEIITTVEGTVGVRGTSVMILVQRAPFEDVPEDSFYFEAVEWAVRNGITTGVTDTTFVPGRDVTRAEVVTFLWRANGSPVVESDKSFPDVTEADFFYDAVIWAAEKGITNGKDSGLFDPYATCTRAEAVTFLYRAKGKPFTTGTENFDDVDKDDFFYKAVIYAVANNITNGIDADSFGSLNICNRAHIVTFLYRASQAAN